MMLTSGVTISTYFESLLQGSVHYVADGKSITLTLMLPGVPTSDHLPALPLRLQFEARILQG